ncbi:ATP-binding cassette sub-family C member 4-like [Ruditapes philippinarum]|uniref:ATP-binding cassette sub-family C member 4-like n=1 Tax=Ruditapes philippinarum TaxID=129788 RepID=UPI00295B1DB5|nr:ATP-binding cassette sub-family C member 4-like [Ruditapes philippinarum]
MASNPRFQASLISKLFFWWLNPIFEKGFKNNLTEDDLYDISNDESSKYLGDKLERIWSEQVKNCKQTKAKPKLYKSLISTFGKSFVLYGFLLCFEEAVVILQPLLLSGLIRYFTKDAPFVSEIEGYMYTGGIGLCALILAFTHHIYYLGVQTIGVKMKIACSSLIYRQTLRLSIDGRRETTTGQIIDLLSNDVSNFTQLMTMLHFLWIGPLEIIVVLIILWIEIGPPAVAGFVVMFLMVPVVHLMGGLITKYEKFSVKHRDNRISSITEIIRAIKEVKLYCWEKLFGDELREERRREVKEQKKVLIVHFVQDILTFVSKFFYILPVIIWMMYTSIDLRASSVFLVLRIYDHAGLIVGRRMFRAYTLLVKTRDVNLQRIQTFLLLDKRKERTYTDPENKSFVDIDIKRAHWEDNENTTLRNISAKVEQGKVLTIVGPVGCGKSSLLMAILNELELKEGKIDVHGRMAYASQHPWLFSGTLKQNITFEKTVDNDKYQKILHACALDEFKDFQKMDDKDATLIGDRGVNLSGGQKSRVNLARALYCDADIYLLDDPLSAVDSETGQHIYKQ